MRFFRQEPLTFVNFITRKTRIMIEWLKNRQQQQRQRAEFDAMTEQDLNDISLTRDELLAVATAPADVLARQQAMAARFGLHSADFNEHRHDLVAAVETCAHCGAIGDCKRYLAGKAPAQGAMDFCPNGDLYASLSRQKNG